MAWCAYNPVWWEAIVRSIWLSIQIALLTLFLAACSWPGAGRTLGAATISAESSQQLVATVQGGAAEPDQVQSAVIDILISTNRIRLGAGQSPLVANSQIMTAAQSRASDMAELGYFDHVHPLRGTAEIERLLRPVFPEARLAELVFLDECELQDLAEFALEAWMADQANREALLDPTYRLVGAGVESGPAGWYTVLALSE